MSLHQGNDQLGVATAQRTVRIERLLPGPVERVWDYITDSEKRGKWLAKGPMADHAGGPVELTFQHSQLSSEPTPEKYRKYEGTKNTGTVLRCEPPTFLSFTWSGESEPSEVSFELQAVGPDTLLTVTHSRLSSRGGMVSVASGWHTHLSVLIAQLNGTKPAIFWSKMEQLEGEYDRALPQ
ncbi:SRPBCC family protein [Phyllobacterium sp. 628]|uniref:SRPBCC family protein n=1 Tax=Phyllobacterium sp. 628 TaxID=2718938 RepID=UPI0016626A38|nr:SRPBCC family protein [Phyllobacterium sp. 628]QND51473.1 SRPBCC family protein [Phyllobacterium sp. 628]